MVLFSSHYKKHKHFVLLHYVSIDLGDSFWSLRVTCYSRVFVFGHGVILVLMSFFKLLAFDKSFVVQASETI